MADQLLGAVMVRFRRLGDDHFLVAVMTHSQQVALEIFRGLSISPQ